ncbi:SUN domain-containing protein 2-like isoform X2 [Siniperca chuatsi]|uniref:SUN domain-containing protein 2-like isoform X2 n=1 Tax=Siniperca chuatsi TaxID=119488 RepID=UPI001CE0368C|nr:SUN domain-containing protein 2-like isoform X2 [Siniperca chuatsi]
MSRRSSRLVSGGYYNSDEESDSSSVTNISYRENPVKVFKKKAGTRKAGPRTPSRANSNASSGSPEPPITAGLSPSPSSSQTQPTMRTVPYIPTMATPRPALTPSSARSQTPSRCPSVPPEKSPYAGLCSSSRPGLHLRPNHKEPSQSAVDSSGYSSSEGNHRKPTAAGATTGSTSRICSDSSAPSTGFRSRISSAFFSLMDSISLMAITVQSKIMHLTALANTSFSSHMKKACGLFLLLLLILLCIWFFLPLLASLISRMTVTKTPSQTKPKSQPVIHGTPSPQLNTMHPTPVVDPAVVSAAIEAKMQRLMEELQLKQYELQLKQERLPSQDPAVVSAAVEAKMQRLMEELQLKQDELQLKQERLLSQMKERLQLDMQDMKAKLEVVNSDSRMHLEQELAGLGMQVVDYQTESHSAAASLSLRIQALEAQNAKLSQEWSSIQLMPPPAPCPDTSANPVQNHLTPELQQAMEKWLTDRIKYVLHVNQEQDAIRLGDKGSYSDCGRPMADKMADFALETQGASVISTRCSETYRIRSACVTLFGFPLWYPSESPRTVIQGFPVLLPGKCWAFHGVQGTLVISLSHPITITHVTLDHLPRYNSPTGRIDSAPKDFEVYGMKDDTEEGTLLGTFTYDENGESTQTFKLPNPSDVVYRFVELRVLTNWGHVEYTCLYRFRVHGQIAST